MQRYILALALLILTTPAGAEVSVSIHASGGQSAADAAKEARLMEWNSPGGRLNYHLNSEYSRMLRGGQPGAAAAPVFLIKLQSGVSPELITSAVDAGVPISSRRLMEIPWPWLEKEDVLDLSFEERLGLLLGSELFLQPKQPE